MTSFAQPAYGAMTIRYKTDTSSLSTTMERAHAAAQAKDDASAARWFAQALQETPDDAQAHLGLGQALCQLGRRDEGTAHVRQAGLHLLPAARLSHNINPLLVPISILQRWSDFSAALELAEQAAAISPTHHRIYPLLALSYGQMNRSAEALVAGERALELDPENSMLHILQASLETDAGRAAQAQQRLEDVVSYELTAQEEFRAHKELARALDKQGEYGQVFHHLHAAGRFAPSVAEISRQNKALIPTMLKANRAGFDRELMGRWAQASFPSGHPPLTFLVGFMRSGTTLTQEVLDAHPGVFVADEADFIWAMHRELHRMDPSDASTADKLRRLDFDGVLQLRAFYWSRVHQRYGSRIGQRMLVDKFTMNTIDLGLINVIFPDAKVVFVMRDPRDVCISCFMQLMAPSPVTAHLLTWQETAAFYATVMDWWMYIQQQMTMACLEFRYEDAVLQFEPTFRKVFDFLGLPWDASVAEFHKRAAGKFISTPSRAQVAQPLYTSSVTRWRHFESEFAPVAELLQPFVTAFHYEPF